VVSGEFDKMHDFSSIHSSWKKGTDESKFNVIEKIFYLKYKLANVWDCYRHSDPSRTWNGHKIRLGLLISKISNSVTYSGNNSFPEIDTGQVYFLNLKLLKGLLNVPVAFEITNIDQNRQILEFSYLDSNKSKGKQTIQFFDDGNGCTRIVHRSYFKSDSLVRDDLYPFFHKKFIREFHRNMAHIVKKNNTTHI
jgi:hypothetical protein